MEKQLNFVVAQEDDIKEVLQNMALQTFSNSSFGSIRVSSFQHSSHTYFIDNLIGFIWVKETVYASFPAACGKAVISKIQENII